MWVESWSLRVEQGRLVSASTCAVVRVTTQLPAGDQTGSSSSTTTWADQVIWADGRGKNFYIKFIKLFYFIDGNVKRSSSTTTWADQVIWEDGRGKAFIISIKLYIIPQAMLILQKHSFSPWTR